MHSILCLYALALTCACPAMDPPSTPLAPLTISRTLAATSQYAGTLHVSVRNDRDEGQDVLYAETLPWLLTLYLHTLSVEIDGTPARVYFTARIQSCAFADVSHGPLYSRRVHPTNLCPYSSLPPNTPPSLPPPPATRDSVPAHARHQSIPEVHRPYA